MDNPIPHGPTTPQPPKGLLQELLQELLQGLLQGLRRFRRGQTGTSAIEFAFIVPLLITLMAGSFEFNNYLRIDRQASRAARLSAEFLAAGIPPNGQFPSSVWLDYVQNITDLFPSQVNVSTANAKYIFLWAIISYTPTVTGCVLGCTYTPKIKSNFTSSGGGLSSLNTYNWTPCTSLTTTSNQSISAYGVNFNGANTISASQAGPEDKIVASVIYQYTPLFGSNFIGNVTITRSAAINAPNSATILTPLPQYWMGCG